MSIGWRQGDFAAAGKAHRALTVKVSTGTALSRTEAKSLLGEIMKKDDRIFVPVAELENIGLDVKLWADATSYPEHRGRLEFDATNDKTKTILGTLKTIATTTYADKAQASRSKSTTQIS